MKMIKDLPEPLKTWAERNYNPSYGQDHYKGDLVNAFDWEKTPEDNAYPDDYFWSDVDSGGSLEFLKQKYPKLPWNETESKHDQEVKAMQEAIEGDQKPTIQELYSNSVEAGLINPLMDGDEKSIDSIQSQLQLENKELKKEIKKLKDKLLSIKNECLNTCKSESYCDQDLGAESMASLILSKFFKSTEQEQAESILKNLSEKVKNELKKLL